MNICNSNTADHKEHRWWILKGNHVIIPRRMYELYLIDYLDEHNIEVIDIDDDSISIPAKDESVVNRVGQKIIPFDDIQLVQTSNFNHEIWYPALQAIEQQIFPWNVCHQFDLDNEDIQDIIRTRRDIDHMSNIRDRIQEFIDQHRESCSRWFVRTGGASPKDLFQDRGSSIHVSDAKEAIRAIALSYRTYDSLTSGLDRSIVLREFVEDIPYELEFRCFIHNGILRAISQNGTPYFIPDIQDCKQEIISRISGFYNFLYPYIPYEDCTMDVVMWDGKGKNKWDIYLLEFNPFGAESLAGSALFNWIRDYNILYNSSSPILRIVEEDSEEQRLLRE